MCIVWSVGIAHGLSILHALDRFMLTMEVGLDLVLEGSFNHQNQRMLGKQKLLDWSHDSMNLRK